jgi:acetyl-CoA acetyltransferase
VRVGGLAPWRDSDVRGSLADAAIAGVATTAMNWRIESNSTQICVEAVRGALDDAGLMLSDIDGIAARWSGPGGTTTEEDPDAADWANLLGIHARYIDNTYPEGVPAVLSAAAAIKAGLCHTVLIVGGEAGVLDAVAAAHYTRPANEFVIPFGSSTPAQFALVAQRYLHDFPDGRQGMAEVAAAIRNMGSRNPEAIMFERGPYTSDDVLNAPMIAEPFTRLDLCLSNEGAAAIIVTSIERARACAHPPVLLLGGGSEWARQEYVEPPRYEEVVHLGRDAVERAFAMGGVAPTDVNVLLLYDPNSFEILRQLEVLGYAGNGEATDFVADVGVDLAGRLPINPHGGLLSDSHVGLGAASLPIIEAVRQLRGTAGGHQVTGAQVAVATAGGSAAQYWSVLVLARE